MSQRRKKNDSKAGLNSFLRVMFPYTFLLLILITLLIYASKHFTMCLEDQFSGTDKRHYYSMTNLNLITKLKTKSHTPNVLLINAEDCTAATLSGTDVIMWVGEWQRLCSTAGFGRSIFNMMPSIMHRLRQSSSVKLNNWPPNVCGRDPLQKRKPSRQVGTTWTSPPVW